MTIANLPGEWPEPIVRVQSLADAGISAIPDRYIKPPSDRPSPPPPQNPASRHLTVGDDDIPLIDVGPLFSGDAPAAAAVADQVTEACRKWGFFQAVSHGVEPEVMDSAREVWREFFHQPAAAKEAYSNSPADYVGYGSRLGVEKGAVLDWNDYFFLHCLPSSLKDHSKWPATPTPLRDVVEKYSEQVIKFCGKLMKILSTNLGLEGGFLQDAFGGEDFAACLRVNFYPKCPQPDLTLGLSSHSDPGGLTVLLPDPDVSGLQVRQNGNWVTVKPVTGALIVNIGDQIQVLSNAIYKSVEHRAIVNSNQERVSLAYFYNPRGDLLIQPAKELVTPKKPALYAPMTFDQYRLYIRTKGPKGKEQLEGFGKKHEG
ncbi:unnamed protein product [Cuscuta campestris]|uniref:feruloyl-CoA 6-hydroxylase n=1 Tax=Cuscuta campestris TaxID=132261 RepID=A0A484MR17_9ASTE|nr:unnamed protein product [Cuscuta campestris]